MLYLLDTNACIRILNNSSAQLIARIKQEVSSNIRICSVVKAELIFGARNSKCSADNLRTLQTFFQPLISLPFDDLCADEYGTLRADLVRRGAIIGANDMMIAATAIANQCTLVTPNIREFSRVIGLQIEDWEV
ncbi:MAG: type II toxin-antitoxin system VapC family toxin [Caldilineaceae bacterium]|nr:type II toxin-antitoxin system VapC family toxin [Caldilineaceae bacterium]